MSSKTLLLIDAIINLILGALLLVFPASVADFLGVPAIIPRFYPSILGAILFGIGLALLIEYTHFKGLTGLGLGGAIAINLSGGITLGGWLLFGDLNLPMKGLLFLWGLVVVLVGISLAELFVYRRKMPQITHIALWTSDLERMKAFYQTWFGAQAGEKYKYPKTGFQSYFLHFKSGPPLEIMTNPEVNTSSPGEMAGYAHIAFALGSKEAVVTLTEKMQGAGVVVLSAPRTTGDGYFESVIADPDGNPVEITVKVRKTTKC